MAAAGASSLRGVYNLVASSMGPAGRGKCLVSRAEGGSVTCTTCSAKLLRHLQPSIAKEGSGAEFLLLLMGLVGGFVERGGDGGLLCVGFACAVIDEALQSSLSKRRIADALVDLSASMDDMLSLGSGKLSSVKRRLRWDQPHELVRVLSSLLEAKALLRLSSEEARRISSTLLDAFVSSLAPDEGASGEALVPRLCYKRVIDASGAGLRYLQGTVLLDVLEPVCPGAWRLDLQFPARTLVFEEALSLPPVTSAPSVRIETSDHREGGGSVREAESSIFDRFAGAVAAVGVTVLCCQKVVHPKLRQLLRGRGIVTFQRLSLRNIGAVAALTGARVVHDVQAALSLGPEGLRRCAGEVLSVERVGETLGTAAAEHPWWGQGQGRKQYTALRGPGTMTTLLVSARDEEELDELALVTERAVAVLREAIVVPFALDGAGVWERALADELEAHASALASEGRHVPQACARMLARALARVAIDPPAGGGAERDGGPLDALGPRRAALTLAVEAASAVLRFGQVVDGRLPT